MFGMLKKALGKSSRETRQTLSKLENKDLMEAIVFGAIYVAAADGELEAAELEKAEKILRNNRAIGSFTSEIATLMDRAKSDFNDGGIRIIRMNAERELRDLASSPKDAETVLVTMLSIAEADGEIDPEEKKVLDRAASLMGLRLNDYL